METPLEVRFHGRTRPRPLIELGLFVVGLAVAWWFDLLPDWLAAVCLAALVLLVVAAGRTGRRLGTERRAAVLDERGIAVEGADLVPWTDLREVVVGPMHPIWLVGSRRVQVVSFLGRSGAELPGPPQPGRRPQSWGRWLRLRLYGTNLLLLASAMTVDGDRIAAAAQELGGLTVRRERPLGFRHVAATLGIAVLLGVAIALVRHLLA